MFVVASKEFSDAVESKRFIVLVVLFGLVMTGAIVTRYVEEVQTMPDGPASPMPRGFLRQMGYMLHITMILVAPVMGVALGCDTISGEREKGTLKIVLAQPVFRDTVINGKFLAATSAVSLAILITSLAGVGAATLILGVTPTGDEALRLALFLIFVVLYTMTYYGIAVFLSTVSKKTSHSVLLSITAWALFTFVIPLVGELIALMIMESIADPEESYRIYWAIREGIASITPYYHFEKISQYLLHPEYIPGGYHPRLTEELVSVTSSLMYAGPNIFVLTIMTTLAFIGSYMVFTRQEIR